MTDELDKLVDRFLSWPLPTSVRSDDCACIQGYPHRVGTHLLTASEARQMLEHVLAGRLDAAPSAGEAAGWQQRESGYLIERIGNAPEWLVGDNDLKFTTDASKAMRFARPDDALLFMCQWAVPRAKELGLRGIHKQVKFTEHEWLPPPADKGGKG